MQLKFVSGLTGYGALALLLLSGTARATESAELEPWKDAHSARIALDVTKTSLDKLALAETRRVQANARRIMAECPYTRSAVQLAELLDKTLKSHDSDQLRQGGKPNELTEQALVHLRTLQGSLAVHGEILEQLGVGQNAQPFLRLGSDVRRTTATAWPARGGTTGVLTMRRSLGRVRAEVDALDDATKESIAKANKALHEATSEQFPFKGQFVGYREDLRKLANLGTSLATDNSSGTGAARKSWSRLAKDSRDLAGLLDTFIGLYC